MTAQELTDERLSAVAHGPGKRIEYLDSLRGLTMILVVYSHMSIIFKPA